MTSEKRGKLFEPQGSNLSFILEKPHSVTFAERPAPTLDADSPADAHDVIVAVAYTGICGSDVHYWQHGRIGNFVLEAPMVLGHESAGTVVATGSSVRHLSVGDRVALEPGYPCRRCAECLAGSYNLCPDIVFCATPPHDGTLTGFWRSPGDFCHKLPDNVSLQEGALIEPLSVGVHACRQARIAPGMRVVVFGAGPVGLLCAAVARAFGAMIVVSVDVVDQKLQFAKKFAATHTFMSTSKSPHEIAKSIVEEANLQNGADAVIDASGAESCIQAGIAVLRAGGNYVQVGMGNPQINFPITDLCVKEITCRGCFRYGPGDYKLAMSLVASGMVRVKELITEVVEFKQAEVAFSKVKEGSVIKILIAGPNEKLSSNQTV